jgi:hypothetical protein
MKECDQADGYEYFERMYSIYLSVVYIQGVTSRRWEQTERLLKDFCNENGVRVLLRNLSNHLQIPYKILQ